MWIIVGPKKDYYLTDLLLIFDHCIKSTNYKLIYLEINVVLGIL